MMENENVSRETIDDPETVEVRCGFCDELFEELYTVAEVRWCFGEMQVCIKCDLEALRPAGSPLSSITKLNNNYQNGGKIE